MDHHGDLGLCNEDLNLVFDHNSEEAAINE